MSPLAQLLVRNQDLLASYSPLHWLNPPDDLPWSTFDFGRKEQRFTQDFHVHRAVENQGLNCEFACLPTLSSDKRTAVLCLPKEKSRLAMLLHFLSANAERIGTVLVAGENSAGAKSAAKSMAPLFAKIQKLDSARHCTLYAADQALPTEPFSLQDYELEQQIDTPTGAMSVVSLPGVFSARTLDPGTALLLSHLPDLSAGHCFMDFGCGSGVIGATLLKTRHGVTGGFVDSNAMALEACRRTIRSNGLAGDIIPSDGLSEINGRYHLIISNPPFHIGHREDRNLSMRLLANVRNFLHEDGQLVMVVNRHLPYRKWVLQTFGSARVMAENNQYIVISNY